MRLQGPPRARGRLRVALVQMPFATTSWPSLGLGLLKSNLNAAGHPTTVLYLNKEFRDALGALYARIARGAPQNVDLLGEWLFGEALWGTDKAADARYLDEVLGGADPAHRKEGARDVVAELLAALPEARAKATSFIEACAGRDWDGFDVVGFTSTFQQHVAALALAKRLKEARPHLHLVFGGANCEGEMGAATLRNFPFVDAVCSGEGDLALPEHLAALAEGRTGGVEGMLVRGETLAPASARAPVELDSLPFPDFDEFFSDAPVDDAAFAREHRLVFESSRGCWWGQKNHCTFCGLNGSTLSFRHKTGSRALAELQHLMERYGRHTRHLTATDNILPYAYFQTFLPQLSELGLGISLFYETKANLKKQQVAAYRAAGLTAIQPGIESLSTPVLKLMRKGVSALQNVQLLKWCAEFGIEAKWNFLAGFPGEEPEWYDGIAGLVRRIRHLAPPVGVSNLRFDRFSPYHSQPAAFGIERLRPYLAYHHVYRGLPPAEVADLAYYFVGSFPGDEATESYTAAAFAELDRWRLDPHGHALFHVSGPDAVAVFDTRGDEPQSFVLAGAHRDVFDATDGIANVEDLRRSLGGPVERIDAAVRDLLRESLLVREGDCVLNVSVPAGSDYRPHPRALDRLRDVFEVERDEAGEPCAVRVRPDGVRKYGANAALVPHA